MFMEANRLVEPQRGVIAFHDAEMEGSYSEFTGCVFKESHCLLAPAPAAASSARALDNSPARVIS